MAEQQTFGFDDTNPVTEETEYVDSINGRYAMAWI